MLQKGFWIGRDRMDYIEYLNRFNRWRDSNDLPGSAVLLYYSLLDRFNRDFWPSSEPVDTLRLMLMTKCKDKEKAGFIRYEKGRKGKSSRYFLLEKRSGIMSVKPTETPTVLPTETPTVLPTQDIRPKTKTKDIPPHTPQGESESFLRFWEAYPRKMDRARAWSAWEQLCPDEGLTAVIMTAVQEQSRSAQWRQEAGRYIPSPEKWLKNRRWEYKLAPAKPEMQRSYDIQDLMKMSQFRVPEKL